MSWLECTPPSEYQETMGKCKMVTIRCPVDVTVKDANGNIVGQIVNEYDNLILQRTIAFTGIPVVNQQTAVCEITTDNADYELLLPDNSTRQPTEVLSGEQLNSIDISAQLFLGLFKVVAKKNFFLKIV